MSYYIGLSFLSNNVEIRQKYAKKGLLRAETRRILSELEGRPIEENDIVREESGRPFFPERLQLPSRAADFNISHSGNAAAVSYFSGGNQGLPAHTGCDIELIRPRAKLREIAGFFTSAERDYIFSKSTDGLQDVSIYRFYEIWTLKESFLKLRGLSVFDMKSAPSFVNDKGQLSFCTQAAIPISFNLYEISGSSEETYILAAALEGSEQTQPEIRGFSYLSFFWKKTAQINAALKPAETMMPNI